jgi:hypothetical protein
MKRLLFIGLLLVGACKESYNPPVKSTNNIYLVVEGFINNGQDSTYITLSHTFKLNDTASSTPELHAQLTVEGKDNSSFPLTEFGNGQYGAASLTLNNAMQYRLHVKTTGGKEYVSDYVDLKVSPPIDSVNWVRKPDGSVQIYANTHDPQNASHYYHWDYLEVWQFYANYEVSFRYLNHQIESFSPDTFYTCWKYNPSTSVLLGSSTKLASDQIAEAPMVVIPANSWEISLEYSILVRQYVLTSQGFDYWQNLQKNTEQIGSIFGPQPSEIKGNIHNIADSTEQVIGFISAGTVQTQRIFITPGQLPGWQMTHFWDCGVFDTSPDSLDYFLGSPISQLALEGSTTSPSGALRYYLTDNVCVDCTLTPQSVNHKPSFWPN